MDNRQFDALSRALSDHHTRRAATGLFATMATSLLTLFGRDDGQDAAAKRRKRRPRKPRKPKTCLPNFQKCRPANGRADSCKWCCSGRSEPNPSGGSRCACANDAAACTVDTDCCTGACRHGRCGACPDPDLARCDPNNADDCTSVVSDPTNCGACGNVCPDDQICNGGTCGCNPANCDGCCDGTVCRAEGDCCGGQAWCRSGSCQSPTPSLADFRGMCSKDESAEQIFCGASRSRPGATPANRHLAAPAARAACR